MNAQECVAIAHETLAKLRAYNLPIQRAAIVGSAFILPSPETAKDLDILICLPENCDIRETLHSFAEAADWTVGYDTETYPTDDFESYRKGDINLLAVNRLIVYDNWLLSAKVCKALALTKREERVIVHQVIMDGQCFWSEQSSWLSLENL